MCALLTYNLDLPASGWAGRLLLTNTRRARRPEETTEEKKKSQ